MNEINYRDSIVVLTETLRAELNNQAESFVKVGYLLKVARDTGILEGTSYASVNDFASSEYGLTPDMVSRYIRIFERFGEGEGDLLPGYKGYGVAKLQIMITLPDEVNGELSPDMTKSQIAEVAAEVHSEQKISDMEVMCEEADGGHTLIQAFFLDYWRTHQAEYIGMTEVFRKDDTAVQVKEFYDLLYPSGIGAIFGRVPGKGKYMISGVAADKPAAVSNVRTGSRYEIEWDHVMDELSRLYIPFTYDGWNARYAEAAPVQEKTDTAKPSPAKAEKKTPEQEYDEQQAKIDRDTKRKLRERQDAEKMAQSPTYREHDLKLTDVFWDDVKSGRKRFELRKNDRGYKVGDTLILHRYADGKDMGDILKLKVTYMLEEYTGLTEGYAILGTELI